MNYKPLSFLLLLPSLIHASELPPLVVTATRTPQADTAAPVSVIEQAELERAAANDIGDVLRFHSGFELGRNGGPGQSASVFMRGMDSNHSLILLNGVKLNPATIGGAALHNINPALLERIEIVKGPRSSLYGADAIGGVVQLFTRRGNSRHFSLSGGETAQVSGGAGLKNDTGSLHADFAYLSADAQTRLDSPHTSEHDNLSVNVGADWRMGEVGLSVNHFQADGNTEYLDYFLTPLDQEYLNSASAVSLDFSPSNIWYSKVQLSMMQDEIEQNQSSDFAHTRRTSLDWQNDIESGARLWTLGVTVNREDASSSIYGSSFDTGIDSYGLFVQNDMRFGRHHFTASLRYSEHEAFDGEITGSLDAAVLLRPGLEALANIGTAFRAPDATDRFGYGGNPDLQPETAQHAEIGLRWQTDTQRVVATLFHTDVDDLITFHDPDGYLGPLDGRNVNLARSRNQGFEFSYRGQFDALTTRLQGIVQDPRNRDSDRQLARRAKAQISAGVDYRYGKTVWSADLLHSGKRKDSDFSEVEMDAYTLLNLGAQWTFMKHWTLFAKLENALDEEYELASGYYTPRQAGWIGVRFVR
jgi:vitamin B12 transporter